MEEQEGAVYDDYYDKDTSGLLEEERRQLCS